MAQAPSWAELTAMLQGAVDIFESTRLYADDTMQADLDTLQQAGEGAYAVSGIANFTDAMESALSRAIARGQFRIFFDQWLREVGKLINSPAQTIQGLFYDLYDYMIDNSYSVNSRNITRGTPAAGGSNTGSGLCSRLTVDENNMPLEASQVETATLICRQDGSMNADRHAERFEIHGQERSRTNMGRNSSGSGIRDEIISAHSGGGPGGSSLINSSFDQSLSGSGADKVPGWTIGGTASNIDRVTDDTFRGNPTTVDGNEASLEFTANETLSQKLSVSGIGVDPSLPYFCRVMVMRKSSATGTVRLRWGSQSVTVSLASLTNDVWTELLATVDENLWPANFTEDELDIQVAVESLAVGTVKVDDLIWQPWFGHNGTWWNLRGGATPWKIDDVFTAADTGGGAASASIQYACYISGYGYFPSDNSGTETITDP